MRNILCILAKEADSFLDIIAPMTKAHMNNILKQEHMTESRLFPNLPFTNIHILSEFTCCMNPRANMDQNSLAVAFFLSNTSLPNATNYLCFPILGKKISVQSGQAIIFKPNYTTFGLSTSNEEISKYVKLM